MCSSDLRCALEQSRKELGEAREKLSAAEESIRQLQAESDTRKDELFRLREEHEKLISSNRELSDSAAAKEAELASLRTERDLLEKQLCDIRSQLDDIEQSKIRVANIELEAYARAKKIEDSAIDNANLARAALNNLFQDAKRRFDHTRNNAAQTFLRMSQELDRLKEVLEHLPESFDAISAEIEALKFGNDKKNNCVPSESPEDNAGDPLDVMQYESIVYPETVSVTDTETSNDPSAGETPDEETAAQQSPAIDGDIGAAE